VIHSYFVLDFVSSIPALLELRAIYIFDGTWQTCLLLCVVPRATQLPVASTVQEVVQVVISRSGMKALFEHSCKKSGCTLFHFSSSVRYVTSVLKPVVGKCLILSLVDSYVPILLKKTLLVKFIKFRRRIILR
jgi:hypothetical protein